MDAQTVRTALGTIQSNPGSETAWQDLSESLSEPGGDLQRAEALALLEAARERHSARGESMTTARLLEMAASVARGTSDEPAVLYELATVLVEELFQGRRAIEVMEKAVESSGGDADMTRALED